MMFAYIDVVAGSMLLQVVGGAILAGVVVGRRIFSAPLSWFRAEESDLDSCESQS